MATAVGIMGTSLRGHRKYTQHLQDKDHTAGIAGYMLRAAVDEGSVKKSKQEIVNALVVDAYARAEIREDEQLIAWLDQVKAEVGDKVVIALESCAAAGTSSECNPVDSASAVVDSPHTPILPDGDGNSSLASVAMAAVASGTSGVMTDLYRRVEETGELASVIIESVKIVAKDLVSQAAEVMTHAPLPHAEAELDRGGK